MDAIELRPWHAYGAAYDYDFFVPVEEQLEALGRLVRDGKVREVRTSFI